MMDRGDDLSLLFFASSSVHVPFASRATLVKNVLNRVRCALVWPHWVLGDGYTTLIRRGFYGQWYGNQLPVARERHMRRDPCSKGTRRIWTVCSDCFASWYADVLWQAEAHNVTCAASKPKPRQPSTCVVDMFDHNGSCCRSNTCVNAAVHDVGQLSVTTEMSSDHFLKSILFSAHAIASVPLLCKIKPRFHHRLPHIQHKFNTAPLSCNNETRESFVMLME